MVKYKPSAADVLDEWIQGERDFLSYFVERQTSFLGSIKNHQNDSFIYWADRIIEHLAPLATSETPFPLEYRTGLHKYPVSVMVSYRNFLQTLCDNQVGLMASFVTPAEGLPESLAPYVSKLESQTTFSHPYLQGYPTDEQTQFYQTLCTYEASLLYHALLDRVGPKVQTLIDRCNVLLKRTGTRTDAIAELEATLASIQKSVSEQKVAFAVTRKGVTHRVYNPRKWRIGYTPSQQEALHYISTAAAAALWKTLTIPQRRPFKALAFGERLVEWLRKPIPREAAPLEPLPNTLNKGYLRYLVEYYRHWQRTNQAMPNPIENLFRIFYPSKDPASDLFMLVDCQAYATPDFVEHVDELGKVLKSATCPHLDKQIIYFLPFGLGCQHWETYTSEYLSQTIAKTMPPVVAHDFRLRDKQSQAWIHSQDPTKWAYTGEWPTVTRYLGNDADVRIMGWQPWSRTIDVEIWKGSEDKILEVFWCRRYLGYLETSGQAEQPEYALARFIVHYENYHDFTVEILWWYKMKPPEFIPLYLEEWGFGPPEMVILLSECWNYDPSGPIPLDIKFTEDWNYIPPPDMSLLKKEEWSN